MTIRLLKRNEINKVAKLFVVSYKKDEKTRRWDESYAEKYILMLYRICKDLCFVAVDNEKIVGVALATVLPEFNKEIIDFKVLLVHPEYRRKKIGSKLMRKVCIKAPAVFCRLSPGAYILLSETFYTRLSPRGLPLRLRW